MHILNGYILNRDFLNMTLLGTAYFTVVGRSGCVFFNTTTSHLESVLVSLDRLLVSLDRSLNSQREMHRTTGL